MRYIVLLIVIFFATYGYCSFSENLNGFVGNDKELSVLYRQILLKNKTLSGKDKEYYKRWQEDNSRIFSEIKYLGDVKKSVVKARFENYLKSFENLSPFKVLLHRIYENGWPFYYSFTGRINIGFNNRLLFSGVGKKVLNYIGQNYILDPDQRNEIQKLVYGRRAYLYYNDFDNDGISDLTIKIVRRNKICSAMAFYRVSEGKTIEKIKVSDTLTAIKCRNNYLEYVVINRKDFLLHYANFDKFKGPATVIELYDLKDSRMVGKLTIKYRAKYSGFFRDKDFPDIRRKIDAIVNHYVYGERPLSETFSNIKFQQDDKLTEVKKRFESSYGKNSHIIKHDIDGDGLKEYLMFSKDKKTNAFIVSDPEDNSAYDFEERFGSKTSIVDFGGNKYSFKNPEYFPFELKGNLYFGKVSFAYKKRSKLNSFLIGIFALKNGEIVNIDNMLAKPKLYPEDFQY